VSDLSRTVVLGAGAGKAAGRRISYRESGSASAPVVLCMHGIGSNSSGYRNQLRGLSRSYRVVSWDAPGYGASEGFADENPSVADYADAAASLLDVLGIARAHAIGSSLGALFAAKLAAVHPERVGCLVLSAPATGFGCRAPGEGTAHAEQRIADLKRLGAEGLARERGAKLVAPDSSPEVLHAARELVASINLPGYSRAARALGNGNLLEDAGRIRAPTLIIVGALDQVTPLAQCARPIHQAIISSRLEVLENVGHLVKLEAPEIFNRLVADFIAAQT
jgi:pimeloyl-ACP methyl ester carboxylesterase